MFDLQSHQHGRCRPARCLREAIGDQTVRAGCRFHRKPVASYWKLLLPEKSNGTHWLCGHRFDREPPPGLSPQIRVPGPMRGLNLIPEESARAVANHLVSQVRPLPRRSPPSRLSIRGSVPELQSGRWPCAYQRVLPNLYHFRCQTAKSRRPGRAVPRTRHVAAPPVRPPPHLGPAPRSKMSGLAPPPSR
jgi:hypothetical protein